MNAAIAAAFKACLLVQHTAFPYGFNNPSVYTYDTGFEKCPAIVAEYQAERATDERADMRAADQATQSAYAAGVEALSQ